MLKFQNPVRGWRQKRRFERSSCKIGIIMLFLLLVRSQGVIAETFTDDLGRKVRIEAPPRRIVSLAPHITETLFALGLDEQVAGVTLFSDYPPEARTRTVVGSYVNLNLEKIVSLAPDLIVSTSDGNSEKDIERLSSMGLPVFVISPPKDFEGVLTSILTIGEITLSESRARWLVHRMTRRMQNVRSKLRRERVRPVFYQLGDNPLMTVGGTTFINSLIELAGGRSIARELRVRYPRFSMEKVLDAAPEVIIISSMADKKVSDHALKKWKRWKEIPAVQNNKIHFINPDLIHRAGPRIIDGLEQLAEMIHPERFSQ